LPGEVVCRVEPVGGRRVGVDAGRAVECGEGGGEGEAGGPGEGRGGRGGGGARGLAGGGHPRVPGWGGAGALFEVRPAVGGSVREPEAKPASEAGGALVEANRRGFGTAGVEPGRQVDHRGG